MRTALRKMGNSTGMIIPKAILTELATGAGTPFEIEVRDRAIVATPIVADPRDKWEEELRAMPPEALTEDERAWMAAGNDFDAEWEW